VARLGESQQEGEEAVDGLGGDAWRSGVAGGSLKRRGTMACGSAVARQRGSRGGRRTGGARGCCEILKILGTTM
jgi:hypothetical protein